MMIFFLKKKDESQENSTKYIPSRGGVFFEVFEDEGLKVEELDGQAYFWKEGFVIAPHETKGGGRANGFPEFEVGVLLFVFFKTSQKITKHGIQRFADGFGPLLQFW